jgi:hypothetical protein
MARSVDTVLCVVALFPEFAQEIVFPRLYPSSFLVFNTLSKRALRVHPISSKGFTRGAGRLEITDWVKGGN